MKAALAKITVGTLAGRWAEHKMTNAAVNERIPVEYLLAMLNFKLLLRVPWKMEAIILTAKLRASFCSPSGLRLHMGHSDAHFRLRALTVGNEGGDTGNQLWDSCAVWKPALEYNGISVMAVRKQRLPLSHLLSNLHHLHKCCLSALMSAFLD